LSQICRVALQISRYCPQIHLFGPQSAKRRLNQC
jgi:hypothetical protein